MQLNVADDVLEKINDSESVLDRLKLYTGWTTEDIARDLERKIRILQWLVKNNIENVDQIGMVMSKYYMGTLKIA
jgi:hypothetical protein